MRYWLVWCSATLFGCAWLPSQTPIEPESHWSSHVLANGLRYHVYPSSDAEISLRLLIHAGSLQEGRQQQGYAHVLEHMAFARQELSPHPVAELFDGSGIHLDADLNADTSYRNTVYKLDLASSRELNAGLKWLSDVAYRQTFSAAQLQHVQKTVQGEITNSHPEMDSFIDKVYEFMLANSDLIHHQPYGTAASVNKLDVKALQSFYQTWYQPQNAEVVVAGNVTAAQVDRLMAEYFAAWQPSAPPTRRPSYHTYPVQLRDYVATISANEAPSVILVADRAKEAIDSLDDQTQLRLERLAYSVINQRLNQVFNQAGHPAQSIYAFDYALEKRRHSFIGVEFGDNQRQACQTLLFRALAELKNQGMQPNEYDTALAYYQEMVEDIDHDWAQQLPMDYAEQKVTALADETVIQSKAQFKTSLTQFLDTVSAQQVDAKLAEILSPPFALMLGASPAEDRTQLRAQIADWKAQLGGR